MEHKEKEKGILNLIVLIMIVISMILLSIYSLITYQTQLNTSLSSKIKQDLQNYTDQSTLLFQNLISDYFRQLDTISLFCSQESGCSTSSINKMLDTYNKDNNYMRIGVSDIKGELYTGIGSFIDISKQDYFKRAISGERVISDVTLNPFTRKDNIVFGIPIWENNTIVGAVIAQYDVDIFTNLLGDSQFKGMGATMVMQKDGKMVSSYSGMENYDTFYHALEDMEFRGEDTVESFQKRVENKESGFLTYYRNGKKRYIYFEPSGIRDYTMISLALADPLDKQADEITKEALWLTIKNVFFYCVILVCVWAIYFVVQKVVKNLEKDQLTLVYNKISAELSIDHYLKRQGRHGRHACLFIDVDNFKGINDNLGHAIGDQVLIHLAEKLTDNFRNSDIISRFGGDEFLIWMKNISSSEIAQKKAEQLCTQLKNMDELPISISIGIAYYPDHGTSYKEIVNHADEALYHSKELGKDRYHIYSREDAPPSSSKG